MALKGRRPSFFLCDLGVVSLRRRVVSLATRRAALRRLFLREFARDHCNHCVVHRVDHQHVVFELDEAILLQHRLLVDQWRRHHIDLDGGRELLAGFGFELVRRLLRTVRGHQRVLNFVTLLVTELQWRFLLRGSGELVRLNRRVVVLCRSRDRQQNQGRAATEQGFHGCSPGSAETTTSTPQAFPHPRLGREDWNAREQMKLTARTSPIFFATTKYRATRRDDAGYHRSRDERLCFLRMRDGNLRRKSCRRDSWEQRCSWRRAFLWPAPRRVPRHLQKPLPELRRVHREFRLPPTVATPAAR